MGNHFIRSILVAAAMLAISPGMLAQTPPGSRAVEARPDLSGIWMRATGIVDSLKHRFAMEEPPLQPWAMEKYKVHREGVTNPEAEGREDLDPVTYCFPAGTPRTMLLNLDTPLEIVQLPDRVYIHFERYPLVRRIYMDGRGHPDGYPSTWMGHSIGEWEGDALVVDTVALNDKTWLDRTGIPHSDALRVVERIRRVAKDRLEIDFLFEDPKTFTKPWGGKKAYRLEPEGEMLEYVPCEEYLEIGSRGWGAR